MSADQEALAAWSRCLVSHFPNRAAAIALSAFEVLRLVLGKMMALLLFGAVVGLILALVMGQVIASIVYQARPRDPLVMVGACITIALLGLCSSWSPAGRAMRGDPRVALRYEIRS